MRPLPPPPLPPLPPLPSPPPPTPPQNPSFLSRIFTPKQTMNREALPPEAGPSPLKTPPQRKNSKPSNPLTEIVISKNQHMVFSSTPDLQQPSYLWHRKTREQPLLRGHRRTNPAIWCSAIICLVFSLLVIFLGIATLIVFLVIKPRSPLFEATNARLNVVYFDSAESFNSDFTFLANFSNPNRKLDVRFEYAMLELYFADKRIATQALQPFVQRRGETGLATIHFISSLVYLPLNHAMELQKQVLSNKVMYSVLGTFRVRASMGLVHFSYWLHGSCQLEMTSPPTGVLLARTSWASSSCAYYPFAFFLYYSINFFKAWPASP